MPLAGIQSLNNGNWENAKGKNPCACQPGCLTATNGWNELKPQESISDSWETKADCQQKAAQGIYRFWFAYDTDSTGDDNPENFKKVYSKTIKVVADAAAAAEKAIEEKELGEFIVCDKIGNLYKDRCYAAVAALKLADTGCKNIGEDRGYCYLAIFEKNHDYCQNITPITAKNRCYEIFANTQKDVYACANITAAGTRENCYWENNSYMIDANLCKEISSIDLRDSCYYNNARRRKDASLCAKLSGPNYLKICEKDAQPSENKTASDWRPYDSPNLIIRFDYPKEWGEISAASDKNGFYKILSPNPMVRDIYFHKVSGRLFFAQRENSIECVYARGNCYPEAIKIIQTDKTIETIYQTDSKQTVWSEKIGKLNFDPAGKYAYFEITGYEYSAPVIMDIDKKTDILKNYDIWLEDPAKSVYWFENGSILAVSSQTSDFGGHGKTAVFVSDPGNPEKLNEVIAISQKEHWEGYGFSDFHYAGNGKIQFLAQKCGYGCTDIKKYEYDATAKKLTAQ